MNPSLPSVALVFLWLPCLLSCEKPPAAPPPPDARPPARELAVTWRETRFFPVELTSSWQGEVSLDDGAVHVMLRGFPEGTRYRADGPGGVSGEITDPLGTDLAVARLAELPLESLAGVPLDDLAHTTIDPRRTLTVTLPGGDHLTLVLPPLPLGNAIASLLSDIERGPLRFEPPPATAAAPAAPAAPAHTKLGSIAYVSSGRVRTVGTARTLIEIDAIALERQPGPPTGSKACAGYGDPTRTGDPKRTLILELKTTDVTVHDRRTGKILHTRTFAPSETCPSWATIEAGETRADSTPPEGDIHEWLTSLVGTAGKR